jgi:hypothetical protein
MRTAGVGVARSGSAGRRGYAWRRCTGQRARERAAGEERTGTGGGFCRAVARAASSRAPVSPAAWTAWGSRSCAASSGRRPHARTHGRARSSQGRHSKHTSSPALTRPRVQAEGVSESAGTRTPVIETTPRSAPGVPGTGLCPGFSAGRNRCPRWGRRSARLPPWQVHAAIQLPLPRAGECTLRYVCPCPARGRGVGVVWLPRPPASL